MRVLHLIDPASPGGGPCTLRLLAMTTRHLTGVEHEVVLLGHGADRAMAARLGVDAARTLATPLGCPVMSVRALARTIREGRDYRGRHDLVHAWTASSAVAAALAMPFGRGRGASNRLLTTMTVGPSDRVAGFALPRLLRRRPCPVLAASIGVRRECIGLGVDALRISVLPPGVECDALLGDEACTRSAIRARWAVADDDFVIGLMSDPPSWATGRDAATVTTMLAEAGRAARLVMHPLTRQRVQVQRWMGRLGLSSHLIIDDELAQPWRVAQGLDAALAAGARVDLRHGPAHASVLPVLWAMASGAPIVAAAGDWTRGVIEDGVNGLLARADDPADVAERLAHLMDDRAAAHRLGAAGRALVHDRFHPSAFCVRLRDVYHRLAHDQPVHVLSPENPDVIEIHEPQGTTRLAASRALEPLTQWHTDCF